jgi:transmembrane sensor
MTKEEIQKLAEKIVTGTATEEEILLYNRLCNYAEMANDATEMPASEKHELGHTLKKSILREISGGARVYKMKRLRFTAAAAIVLLLAGGGYFFLTRSGNSKPDYTHQSKQPVTNDALPGTQGAVLTLANGRQIILDSAANGALASEGGAQVIKKNGEVIYDAQKAPDAVAWNTMTTPLGRQYQLTLSDGTAVWLNAGSSITYPVVFTGKDRVVKISGEVYFEVKPSRQVGTGGEQEKIPFTVKIVKGKGEGGEVKVLGTHFNINAYDDEPAIKTTLLEGSVKVVNGQWSMVDKHRNNYEEAILKPGEQALLTSHSPLTINHSPDVELVMAWKNGRFLFSGTDIGELMRQIARWYDVEVVYDAAVKDIFYAEIPRNTKLSDVLKALELTGRVHFVIEGRKIIVKP